MPVYTVHAPGTGNAGIAAPDRFVFVRDGFYVWAALLGVVWLAWHRLWLALIGWIVVIAAIVTPTLPPAAPQYSRLSVGWHWLELSQQPVQAGLQTQVCASPQA